MARRTIMMVLPSLCMRFALLKYKEKYHIKLHNHMDINKEYSTKHRNFRYYVILSLYFIFWLQQDTSEIMKQFGILLIFVATAMSVEGVHPQYHSKCKQNFSIYEFLRKNFGPNSKPSM